MLAFLDKNSTELAEFRDSDADQMIESWEIPSCDCQPEWVGEYLDEWNNSVSIRLGTDRREARRLYEEQMSELNIPKGDRRGEIIPVYPFCEHVQSADNGMTIEQWLDRLHSIDPTEYCDPLFMGRPSNTWPGTKARVEEYRERVELGLHLWDPCDLSEDCPFVDIDGVAVAIDSRLGVGVSRHANGEDITAGTRISGETHEDEM